MADEKTGEEKKVLQTLTDDQIVTDRKMPRRSFLAATGAVLIGAAAVATGVRAGVLPQQADPDSKKKEPGSDPDSKKTTKKTGKKSGKKSKKGEEKGSDPDSKKKPGPG